MKYNYTYGEYTELIIELIIMMPMQDPRSNPYNRELIEQAGAAYAAAVSAGIHSIKATVSQQDASTFRSFRAEDWLATFSKTTQ